MKQSHKLQSYQHDDITTTGSSSTFTSTLSLVGNNCVNNSSNNGKQQRTKLITSFFIILLAMIIVGIMTINYNCNDSSNFQQQQDTIIINTKFMDVSIVEETYKGSVHVQKTPDKLYSHSEDNDNDNIEEIITIESQHNYVDNDNDSTIDRIQKIRQQLYNLQQYINGTIYFPYMEHYNTILNARWVKQYIPTKSLLNSNYNNSNTLGIIIIQVQDEIDVQITVPILSYLYNTYDIPFRIRSGGHHKSGYSSLVDEIMKHDNPNDSSSSSSSSSFDGIILCLSRLNRITMVPSLSSSSSKDKYQSIIIGPAVRVLDILQQVTRPYMYGGVIGYCNQVAESGFILGGGFGMQSRMYGLGLDSVLSFNIVLANGTMITTKSTTTTDLRMSISDHKSSINHNSDLFWALRGAGSGSYGVVTQMEYRIHPVSDTLHYVGLHLNDPSDISYFLYNMGRMSSNIPDNVALMFDEINTMNMIWTGRDESDVYNGDAYLHDLVTSIMEPKVQELDIKQGTISWLGTFGPTMDQPATNNSSSDDDDNKKSSNWGNTVWAAACWTGFLLPENNTIEVWDDIIHYLDIGLSYSSPYLAPDIEFWGGAIGRHPSDATAFPYRSAIYNVGVLLTIAENEPNASALFARESNKVNEWWHKVDRYLTGSYVNYPTVSLLNHDDPKHYAHVLWGENLPRLVKIKQQYDPDNVFQFPMSVPNEL